MDDQINIAKEREEKLEQLKHRGEESSTARKAQALGLAYLNLASIPLDRDNLQLVPKAEAQRAGIVLVRRDKKTLKMGVLDPVNEETKQILERLKRQGFGIELSLISPSSFKRALGEYDLLPEQQPPPEVAGVVSVDLDDSTITLQGLKDYLSSLKAGQTGELLEKILYYALKLKASDIHIEPAEKDIRIRLRLDGILEEAGAITQDQYHLLLSRIKLVSGIQLNISQTPQDGRFTLKTNAFEAEARISVLPGEYGEYIVIRVLNPSEIKLEVKDLGIRDFLWERIKKEIEKPNGIVLVTGPTGSGKTTTLYAFLKYLRKPGVKIVTLEDPVEYHLEGISQSQIETEKNYTFAEGLRSVLRQDPDVVLVGEIRDEETAQTALNAALTGHFVFSTLHTNDAPGAIPRFLDLNAKPKILAAALNAVIAQRLVRKLCTDCRKERPITEQEKQILKEGLVQEKEAIEKFEKTESLYGPAGCGACSQTGYRGRIGIFEILINEPQVEELIGGEPTHSQILGVAQKNGFLSMYHDGLLKVLDGITTLDEVKRVAEALR